MNQNIKRLIKYLIMVLVTTFIFVVFCFSPDILLNIRLFLIKYKPWKYLFNSSVTNEIYTEVILGAFLNCLAIIISILAFKSADAAKKIQEAQHKAKIIEESSKLVSFIKSSMTIIYDLSKSIGNESELHIDFVNNYANHLFADNKISKEDFDYINEFIKKLSASKIIIAFLTQITKIRKLMNLSKNILMIV